MRRNMIAGLAMAVSLLAAAACTADGPTASSGQGGYLGQNPGARMTAQATPNPDMRSSPAAWCIHSPEPSRCRARMAAEDEICKGAANYEACRFAVDQMHGP